MASRRFARASHSSPVGWPPLCVANRIFRSIAPNLRRDAHELREESVEVMHTAFSRRRVTSALVQARAHTALHGLDDGLVLALHTIEARARAGIALGRIPDEWKERDACPVHGEWRDHVHGHAPG